MKITKLHYFDTFEIIQGHRRFTKVGFEAEIDDEFEDVRDCYYKLKRKSEELFYESKASSEKQMGTQVTDVKENSILKVAELIQQINSCTGMEGDKGLLSFKFVVVGNLSLQNAYDNKYSELNNNNKP